MAEDILGEKIVISKVLVRNEDGDFLVVKEREDWDKETAGKWELPGGRLKYGENQFEAAIREVKEDSGLILEEFSDLARVEIEDGK